MGEMTYKPASPMRRVNLKDPWCNVFMNSSQLSAKACTLVTVLVLTLLLASCAAIPRHKSQQFQLSVGDKFETYSTGTFVLKEVTADSITISSQSNSKRRDSNIPYFSSNKRNSYGINSAESLDVLSIDPEEETALIKIHWSQPGFFLWY